VTEGEPASAARTPARAGIRAQRAAAPRRATAEPEEIELKFSFADGEAIADWLDANFPLDHAGWRTLEITDRYFDTPDLALSAAGYGARLRTVGSDTTLTVKADIEVGDGLHRRLELEAPATRSLNVRNWPESEARSRLLDVVADRRLVERFVVGQQRRERAIDFDGTRAVASIDEGEVEYLGIAAGDIRQFEVELVSGDADALRSFAARFAETGFGKAQDRSKFAVAGDLVERVARVGPDDKWPVGARKLLRRHLIRMLERERATRDGDPLALKQMRVATRRMRATWRVFRGAFAGGHARHFEDGLRRVADLLGAVRDLDVLIESVEKRDDVDALTASWRGRRDASFDALVKYLDSRAYDRFVDGFLDGTGAAGLWATGKRASVTVAERAPSRLEDARATMLEAAAQASGSNEAAAWHALRIAAKRMRYALEAFREVSDDHAAGQFIEPLRELQDKLGEMNDASVAAYEAAAWLMSDDAADAPPEQRVAVAHFIGEREQLVVKARDRFADVWAQVAQRDLPLIEGQLTNR
jgi:triphosphatase